MLENGKALLLAKPCHAHFSLKAVATVTPLVSPSSSRTNREKAENQGTEVRREIRVQSFFPALLDFTFPRSARAAW